jgi:hypothetical protein
MTLRKARLIQIGGDNKPTNNGKNVPVQFNPDSLKLSYTNQITPPQNASPADAAGGRFVGTGVTKLAAQLWFDAGSPTSTGNGVDDVRRLTQEVAFFMTPIQQGRDHVAPGVRFEWGSFGFNGMMESFEENLEYFSPDGKPLRASVTFAITAPRIVMLQSFTGAGTRKLAVVQAGDSLQRMSAARGAPENWRAVARANNIEDPLRLPPGQMLDLSSLSRSSG